MDESRPCSLNLGRSLELDRGGKLKIILQRPTISLQSDKLPLVPDVYTFFLKAHGSPTCAPTKVAYPYLQVAVFSWTWPAPRRAGQHMPHKAGVDGYFISVGERQPAQQVCIAKNSFPESRASLRTSELVCAEKCAN
jgi:hypothetical protein